MAAERRIAGAFEVAEFGHVEELTIVTKRGLLQRNFKLPAVEVSHETHPGNRRPYSIEILTDIPGPKIISVVNAHETPVCDVQTKALDRACAPNGIPMVSISRQHPGELARIRRKEGIESSLYSISEEGAIELGVALEPAEGASEAWKDMLLRTLIVVGVDNIIAHIEHVMDQAREPNYEAATYVVHALQALAQ